MNENVYEAFKCICRFDFECSRDRLGLPTACRPNLPNGSRTFRSPTRSQRPMAFKWSLGFSPGVVVVHTDNRPIFTAAKKDRGQGLEHNPRTAIQACSQSRSRVVREYNRSRLSTPLSAPALQARSLQAPPMNSLYPPCRKTDCASFHLSLTSNQQDFLNNTAKELTEVSYE